MPRTSMALAGLVAVSFAVARADAQAVTGPTLSKKQAALHAQAKVSEDSARAIALRAVPGATVKEYELEKENGKLIWSFDLKVAGKKGVEEVQVDAITGKVVSHEHESNAKEAKEARDEAQARAKAKTPKP